MSNTKFDFINAYDSRLRAVENSKPQYELPLGCKNVDFRNIQSSNGTSTTSTSYTLYLSPSTICSDLFYEEVKFTVGFTVDNTTNAPLYAFQTGSIAPRLLPLTNASSNISISLNGRQINMSPQDILTPLMSFNKPYGSKDLPSCSMLDSFTDIPVQDGAPYFESALGSLKNPMLDYFSSVNNSDCGRFSEIEIDSTIFDNTAIPANGSNDVFISFTVREPIITGATSLVNEHASGFSGLSTIQINRTFVSNLAARLVNFITSNALTVSNPTVTIEQPPVLYYCVYTPLHAITYPTYYPIINYSQQVLTNGSNTASGATCTISSPAISLSHVPRCIYVWMAVPNSNKDWTDSDAPGTQIVNLSVSYNNVSGQFSSMGVHQIYNEFMCKQGSIKDFNETGYAYSINANNGQLNQTGLFGSVLRIAPESMTGIDWTKYSVGSPLNAIFQIQVTAKNLSANAITPSLFVQVVYDNLLEISGPTTAMIYDSVIDESTVRHVRANAPSEILSGAMLGGAFRDMKKRARRVGGGIWDVLKNVGTNVVSNLPQIISTGTQLAPLLGFGKKSKKVKTHRRGGSLDSDSEDDEMIGGRLISRSDLARRL